MDRRNEIKEIYNEVVTILCNGSYADLEESLAKLDISLFETDGIEMKTVTQIFQELSKIAKENGVYNLGSKE